jgi:hypothetical protein
MTKDLIKYFIAFALNTEKRKIILKRINPIINEVIAIIKISRRLIPFFSNSTIFIGSGVGGDMTVI